MNVLLLLLVISRGSPAQPPDVAPTPGEVFEIACLALKDPAACDTAFRRAQQSGDGEIFARVGCDELKSARSCVQLGDWWTAARGPAVATDAQILDVYTRGCTADSPLGCARVLERHRLANADKYGRAVTIDRAHVDQLVSQICAAGAADPSCVTARATQDEFARRLDPAYGACRVDALVFRENANEPTPRRVPSASPAPLTRAACLTECQRIVEQSDPHVDGQLQWRGRCHWGETYLPPAFWRAFAAKAACPAGGRSIGDDNAPLFARCHCDRAILEAANRLAAPFGAYVRAGVAFSKRFGRETLHRCGARAYFDDEAKADPRCAANAKILGRKLTAEPSLRDFQVSLKTLTCAGAKP